MDSLKKHFNSLDRYSKAALLVILALILIAFFLNLFKGLPPIYQDQDSVWYKNAQAQIKVNNTIKPIQTKAKNIILFVGDGMSVGTVTAARILEAQLRGEEGEENLLSWEHFPNLALSKTYNTNQQTPDSAGTATAFITGHKTRAGVISVKENVELGDCLGALNNPLTSFLELAEHSGLATGIISTARLTHATPATSYAHSPNRSWENDSAVPEIALLKGCKDIARQFVDFNFGDGIDVTFAGGRSQFIPADQKGPENKWGKRKDGRDLLKQWQKKHKSGTYVWNNKGFNAIPDDTASPVLGLFHPSHMQYSADRNKSALGEPSLAEMTEKSIKILENKKDGYFLFVEAGRIDHGHHNNSAYNALHDTIAFHEAVKKATEMTNSEETLIIVTADHAHGFTMGGYSPKGSDILGKVTSSKKNDAGQYAIRLAKDGKPYSIIGYYGGSTTDYDGIRPDISQIDTASKTYKQQTIIPLPKGTHSTEDVAIYARGPSAHLFRGVVEQNYIFHVMYHASRMQDRLD